MTGSSLEAKWVAPAYAPGEVSKYQWVLYTGSFPTKTETATQTTHTFQGLDTNSIYRVGVSAIIAPNDQHLGGGMGPESLSDFVGSPVAVPEPEAPTILKAEVVGPNAIKLTWTAPSNVLVYYYKVIITDAGGMSRTEVAAASDVLRLLTGLKPNTEYNIVMRAASMEKESGDSKPATATTAHGVSHRSLALLLTSSLSFFFFFFVLLII
ncbi:unnamed protein product [Dibothriocephalus latus]|uniref:Fibronectin type-III domain-containing protein n=1 Tax=Dibothriocephalus latus TaxID=60516 RepID=A0A3P7P6Y6_DIBLA|nr:unnamed protein product [Dibothriocephalus latus]